MKGTLEMQKVSSEKTLHIAVSAPAIIEEWAVEHAKEGKFTKRLSPDNLSFSNPEKEVRLYLPYYMNNIDAVATYR